MIAPVRVVVLLCLGALWTALPAHGQKKWYEAAAKDSMMSLGFDYLTTEDGDTIFVDIYRSYAPIGDTIVPRRQALVSWSGVSAIVKTRGYRHAAILYLWPQDPTDSLVSGDIAAVWAMRFAQDEDGCWHIVNDTTPISTCVLRDDPNSPGAVGHRRPSP